MPIPDVKGKTVEEATASLTAAGFTVSPDTVFVDRLHARARQVLSTNPPFGESAVQGTAVILTVSQAPDQTSAFPMSPARPAMRRRPLLEAEPYTFVVTHHTGAECRRSPANTVLRTDPAVNTPVAKGSPITRRRLGRSGQGQGAAGRGSHRGAARNQLTNRGLVPDVQYVIVAIGSPDDGHVISQNIPPTESVRPGHHDPAEGRQGSGRADDHDSADHDYAADHDHHATDRQPGRSP